MLVLPLELVACSGSKTATTSAPTTSQPSDVFSRIPAIVLERGHRLRPAPVDPRLGSGDAGARRPLADGRSDLTGQLGRRRRRRGRACHRQPARGAHARGRAGAPRGPGDVLVALAGRPLENVEDLFAALRRRRPGQDVEIELLRDGARRTVKVRLSARPE